MSCHPHLCYICRSETVSHRSTSYLIVCRGAAHRTNASHQRRLSRFSKYVGRRSQGCITSQKIGGMTITVCHGLSTEDHLEQKVACSTITRSHASRTEVSILRASPSHLIAYHLTRKAQEEGSASHLILLSLKRVYL
jgi:hypothetical protein